MREVLSSLAYLIAVLMALHFLGRGVSRLLKLRIPANTGLFIALGIATFVALCGVLEFARCANALTFLSMIAIGTFGQSVAVFQSVRKSHSPAGVLDGNSPLVIFAFGLFGILYAAFLVNSAVWHYQFIDDLHGYLIFPERILGEGSIGRDPFNFRRIETGLTGGAYIYALFRAGLDISQTRLADTGVGSACLLLMMGGWARQQGLSGVRLAMVVLITLAVVAFSPIINNTPETVGKALLFATLWLVFIFDGDTLSLRRAAVLGLMLFACAGLKTTYLPEVTAIIMAFYISAAFKYPTKTVAANAAMSGLTALFLMLPWMIVSHSVAGTFWYPVLGTGTLNSNETAGFVSFGKLITDGGRVVFILVPAAIGAYLAYGRAEMRSKHLFYILVMLISAGITILSQLKFTAFGYRYGHAGAAAIMLFFVPFILQRQSKTVVQGMGIATLIACLAVMVQSKTTAERWLSDGILFQPSFAVEANETKQLQRYRALQKAVPAGEGILAVLKSPFLLDFGRNHIAVMDHAGRMGPGVMPDLDDAPGWARYLKSLGLHYVAYSYKDEGGLDATRQNHIIRDFSAHGTYSRFMVDDARAGIEVRKTLVAFQKIGKTIYDDGDEFLVYLP